MIVFCPHVNIKMSSEFFANLNDLDLPKSDPSQDKSIHLSDFNSLLDQDVRYPDTSFKDEMHTAFRAMLDDISPVQNKVEDMNPEYTHVNIWGSLNQK